MGSRYSVRRFFCLALVLLSSFTLFAADGPAITITLAVDASDAPRKMIHAQLRIPAKPGTLTLYYPKWIPGEHGPTGPITDLMMFGSLDANAMASFSLAGSFSNSSRRSGTP